VAGTVVQHDVDLQCRIDAAVDVVQERAEVDRVVLARDRLGEDLAAVHVKGREQRGGAVADVLELAASKLPGFGGLVRVAALLGLDRGLLINREHQCPLGWVEVETTHVADAFPKRRVITAVQPATDARQIDVHCGEDVPHLRHRHLDPFLAQRLGDLEIRPGRDRIFRVALRGRDSGHLQPRVVIKPARSTTARGIDEPVETRDQKAAPPHGHLMLVQPDRRTDLTQGDTFSAHQDRPRPTRLTLGRRMRPRPPFELHTLVPADLQHRHREHRHPRLQKPTGPSNHTRVTSAGTH